MTLSITALHTLQDGHQLTEPLIVRHARDRNDKPLCIVRSFPGLDAERSPAQLEALARQLVCAARDAQSGATGERQYPNLNDAVPRHPATPSFFEYPTFDESADMDPCMLRGRHD